jgi:hypothetical protein
MKVLFVLIMIAGFGFWMTKEMQHEQELQTQLDEARQELVEMHKQYQTTGPGARQTGPGSWMWEKKDTNPLNEPAARVRY